MVSHSVAPLGEGKIGGSLPMVNRQKPTDEKKFTHPPPAIVLSDYRCSLVRHGSKDANGQRALLGPTNIMPSIQQLDRARIIYELAASWGVDLRLVIAMASAAVAAGGGS